MGVSDQFPGFSYVAFADTCLIKPKVLPAGRHIILETT